MHIEPPSPLFVLALLAVGLPALLAGGRVMARRRLTRWCAEQGLALVSWRGARFYEGPRGWRRTEDDDGYRVEVRDRTGSVRSGFVDFDNRWWPFRSPRIHVQWD